MKAYEARYREIDKDGLNKRLVAGVLMRHGVEGPFLIMQRKDPRGPSMWVPYSYVAEDRRGRTFEVRLDLVAHDAKSELLYGTVTPMDVVAGEIEEVAGFPRGDRRFYPWGGPEDEVFQQMRQAARNLYLDSHKGKPFFITPGFNAFLAVNPGGEVYRVTADAKHKPILLDDMSMEDVPEVLVQSTYLISCWNGTEFSPRELLRRYPPTHFIAPGTIAATVNAESLPGSLVRSLGGTPFTAQVALLEDVVPEGGVKQTYSINVDRLHRLTLEQARQAVAWMEQGLDRGMSLAEVLADQPKIGPLGALLPPRWIAEAELEAEAGDEADETEDTDSPEP